MAGTFRWNIVVGLIGFAVNLMISLPNNVMKTAFIQSGYSFIFLFLFTFLVRWLIGMILHSVEAPQVPDLQDTPSGPTVGRTIDLATPDEDAGMAAVGDSEQAEEGFAPLRPPKLSTKIEQSPEELAQILRQMTEK